MREDGIARLRIGELSRRVDVPATLLRAWERRYGLLDPIRSEGNFRLYSLDDVARIWAMKANLARGFAAAEAARLAISESAEAPPSASRRDSAPAKAASSPGTVAELRAALARFDEAGAQAILDRALALDQLEQVLADLVLPCLRGIGDDWERGELGVAEEHFASNLLRGRLLSLAKGWNAGAGPAAVLSCPPGELHDIGLICFGLALWRRGWRIFYIGQDTPVDELRRMTSSMPVALLVLAAHAADLFADPAAELRELAGKAPLAIAGAGANPRIAAELGAMMLGGDPIAAAAAIASS